MSRGSFEASKFVEVLDTGVTEFAPVHDNTSLSRFTTKSGYVTRDRKSCHFDRNLCQNRPETTLEMVSFPLQSDITRNKKQPLTSGIPPQNDIVFPLLNDIK